MAEETLESLARRVEELTARVEALEPLARRLTALEKFVLGQPPMAMLPPGHIVYPPKVDWATALNAVEELSDYDFDAVREGRECGQKNAREHA